MLFLFLCMIGISTNNLVIPTDFGYDDIGNLNQIVLTTGKLLLDAFYNASNPILYRKHIFLFQEQLKCGLHFLQKLYCCKERLMGSGEAKTKMIKFHGVMHQLLDSKDLGVCAARDTSVYENMHLSTTKDPYRESSRRRDTTQKELMHKNQMKR
jgi:hypothetical protein